jgi:NMD protein affecting ribosome stability and mRNA decay
VTGCPTCQASYRGGRWTWDKPPAEAVQQVCPACQRIADGYPAGLLHVGGSFAARHRDEITHLLRNVEERESSRHPLKRIMAIEDEGGGFAVSTTDAKLARALGRALKKAYAGDLEQPPTTAERENLVRVRWQREES